MRPLLRHQLGQRRRPHPARQRSGRLALLIHRRTPGPAPSSPGPAPSSPDSSPAAPARSQAAPDAVAPDYAALRVRRAGGPTDEASYSCSCGYVFAAPVSASVSCPHCGGEQAW